MINFSKLKNFLIKSILLRNSIEKKNSKLPLIYNQKIRNEVLKLQKTDGQYNFNRLAFIGDNILGVNSKFIYLINLFNNKYCYF